MARRDAVRITTAPMSAADDTRSRQRRYLWSMFVRTVCFVAAVVVGPGWLRWVLVVGAVFLPYVAVVMANAADRRRPDVALLDGLSTTRELPTNPSDRADPSN